jgi:hypothetical protein
MMCVHQQMFVLLLLGGRFEGGHTQLVDVRVKQLLMLLLLPPPLLLPLLLLSGRCFEGGNR